MCKVYEALCKLKDINPLYSQITLPSSATSLNLDQRITEVKSTGTDGTDAAIDEEIEPENEQVPVRESMVRRIETEEVQQLYENYTIQPLHVPRANEKSTTLSIFAY